jgi:hypothetical protein
MGRSRNVGCLVAVSLAALVSAAAAVAATTTRQAKPVFDLTLRGSGNDGLSIAFAVNDKGRVVGGSTPDTVSFSTHSASTGKASVKA